MNDPAPDKESSTGPTQRFEATVHPGSEGRALQEVANFDLDRIPDPEGTVRVLIDAQQASELVGRGFEVRLLKALPIQPLNASLILDEGGPKDPLEERIRRILSEGKQ